MDNIAIIRRNGLGDLLCSYPLILYLQNKHPNAKITLFVDKRNSCLTPYLPAVHQVVVLPDKGNKYWNHFRIAWAYRKKFDLAISAKTSPMKLVNLFLYVLRAKKRVAYVDNNWHGKLVNAPLLYDAKTAARLHQALKGLHTVAPGLDAVPEELYPRISIPRSIKNKYPLKRSYSFPTVLVSATTTNEANRLCAERYAALLNRLNQYSPIGVVVVGQKKDAQRAHAISQKLQMPNQVHFPRNFDAFMVLLDACEMFFVGDGGIAHIGAALGKKEVALFGQTSPIQWHPLSHDVEMHYHPEHVNYLSEAQIFQALKCKLNEVKSCGRKDL